MSASETRSTGRKTNTLGISRIPEDATILTVAKACERFLPWVKGIRILKFRSDNTRNAMIDFIAAKHCEDAKEFGDVSINGIPYPLHYARSRDSQPFNVSASENKLYVKFPEAAKESDIVRMLGDVSISKPENAKNYFFATCKDIDQQCALVKTLNNKPVAGGELVVKVAIDKTRKMRTSTRQA